MPMIAYLPGVFDLLHVGHLTIIEQSKKLHEVKTLIVGIPSDEVVEQDKGSMPAITLTDRMRMVAALKCVDAVLPYFELNFMEHLETIRPQVLVVGEDWGGSDRHQKAEQWICSHYGRIVRMPYYRQESTTRIKHRIKFGITVNDRP